MTSHPTPRRPRQHGVSLIELMIGMAIGLLAVLVMTQVTVVFEGRKRSTTSGSDAQVNGALALQALQRDIQMAGYGMTSGGAAGCTLRGKRIAVVPPWDSQPLVGVRITQGASEAPDSLDILMSGQRGFSLPVRVYESQRRDATSFVIDANTNLGNAEGDLMVAVPNPAPTSSQVTPTWCTVFNISAPPTGNTLEHVASAASGPWNQDSTATLFPGALNADISYAAGSHLINLGQLNHRSYSVRKGTLCLANFSSTTGTFSTSATTDQACYLSTDTTREDLYAQIINLQAVYGLDTSSPADNVVDSWTATSPTTQAGWAQVIAIRVAVVARTTQYEGKAGDTTFATSAEPSWKPDGVTAATLKVQGLVTCPASDASCWKHYRYRVFETVVPLRNMLWQS